MASPYNPLAKASFTTQAYTYYPLLSDGDDVVSRPGTIASGIGVLVRGTIVKCDPATGAITVPVVVADCNGILANDYDATSATVPANVYLTGKFKADAITWPGALSHALVSDQLRDYGMYIESVAFTDGTMVKSVPTEAEQARAKKEVEENRAAAEKAAKEAEKAAKEGVTKEGEPPPADSAWAYLTPEERALHPELANPPVETKPAEEGGNEGKAQPPVREPHRGEPPHSPKR
jgi:hypothetical protein